MHPTRSRWNRNRFPVTGLSARRRRLLPALAAALGTGLTAPAAAQLAPAEATIYRLPFNEDLAVGSAIATGDFDSDGLPDRALGAPFSEDAGATRAGAVIVQYGDGSAHFLNQSTSGIAVAEPYDNFGAELVAGDLNCDGFDDLAVGIPGEDFAGDDDTGAVIVYYGTAAGLPQGAQSLLFLSDVATNVVLSHAFFGSRLARLEFPGGKAELAIGAWSLDLPSGVSGVGGVFVVPHACPGTWFETGQALELIQGRGGVVGNAGHNDGFGKALAVGDFDGALGPDLAVGVHRDRVGAIECGSVHVFYGGQTGLSVLGNANWDEGDPGVPGTPDNGDHFGWAVAAGDFDRDGYDDLAVGVPYEDVNGVVWAGTVTVLYGSLAGIASARAQLFSQDSGGVVGTAEAGDHFGWTLAAGDFSGDGHADLAIGVINEDLTVQDAGFINVLYSNAAGLTGVRSQGFSEADLPPPAAEGDFDRFGRVLAAVDWNGDRIADLAAANPSELFNGFEVGLVAWIPGRPLFADGFESGDATRWSALVP